MREQIEAESKRRTLLADELRWQMHGVDRVGDNYTWLDALNDSFDLAVDHGNNKIKRQCLRLYKELGLLNEVDLSKITVFGRGPKTRGFHKIDGSYYSLNRPMKVQKEIGGKMYDYVLCERCEVWIPAEKFINGTHENCDTLFKNLQVRKRAEARVI